MTTMAEVHKQLIIAYQKASAASDKWNELNRQIIEREEIYCRNVGLDAVTKADRISDVKKKAEELKNLFGTYSFWKGEVERHSAMLTALVAWNSYHARQPIDACP